MELLPKFTKQHYEVIAGILNGYSRMKVEDREMMIPLSALVEVFRFYFANDNPNFDAGRFTKACYHE